VQITEGNGDFLLGTRDGWGHPLPGRGVRPMGRTAAACAGIKLRDETDVVVGMAVVPARRSGHPG
jgi:hypothetical protein